MSNIKILKTGKFSLHPALGPAIDIVEGEIIDPLVRTEFDEAAIENLKSCGWAEDVEPEKAEDLPEDITPSKKSKKNKK